MRSRTSRHVVLCRCAMSGCHLWPPYVGSVSCASKLRVCKTRASTARPAPTHDRGLKRFAWRRPCAGAHASAPLPARPCAVCHTFHCRRHCSRSRSARCGAYRFRSSSLRAAWPSFRVWRGVGSSDRAFLPLWAYAFTLPLAVGRPATVAALPVSLAFAVYRVGGSCEN